MPENHENNPQDGSPDLRREGRLFGAQQEPWRNGDGISGDK